jgi:hypothetical protein
MYEKNLCPVGFDQNSAEAMHFAIGLAQPNGRVYLLHVIPEEARPASDLGPSIVELARECLEDFAREQPATEVSPC